MRRTRTSLLAAGIVGLMLLGTACSAGSTSTSSSSTAAGSAGGSSADSAAAGTGTDTLNIGFVLEPTSLDFTQTDGAAIPQALLLNVYETLVKQDENGEIVPLLAKSWTVSDDKMTYDFVLQEGAKFTSGAVFTASDAVFSLNRVKTDWKSSVKTTLDVVSNAEAVSPTELKITLSRPSTSFLFTLTTRVGAMFSQTGVSDLATTPIGTGPYEFDSWVKGSAITLTRSDVYWGTPPSFGTMVLRYFSDPTAMNSAMLSGGIQVMSTVQTPEAISQFDDSTKYQVIDGTTTGEVMLSMNNRKGALADPRVRQAITYALDRQAILKTAWAGYGTLIGTHEAPTDPWFFPVDPYPHDPQKAKDLLAQAGVPSLTLSLKLPPVPYASAAAPLVISQLAAVGITVQDSNVDFAGWLAQVFNAPNDYDLTIINHVEPRDAPTIFGNANYYIGYDNAAVRDLFTKADSELTQEAANTDYQQALTQLAQDAPVVWLWSFPNLLVADVDVQGLVKNQISAAFELAQLSVS